VKFSQRPN